MKSPKQIAKAFRDHFIGRYKYPKGDDGLCKVCIKLALQVQLEALLWAYRSSSLKQAIKIDKLSKDFIELDK